MTEKTSRHEASTFERFVASNGGRVIRALVGIGLITAGLGVVRGATGVALGVIGLVPIATGVFNLCPIAPIWGGHFFGSQYCQSRDGGGAGHVIRDLRGPAEEVVQHAGVALDGTLYPDVNFTGERIEDSCPLN